MKTESKKLSIFFQLFYVVTLFLFAFGLWLQADLPAKKIDNLNGGNSSETPASNCINCHAEKVAGLKHNPHDILYFKSESIDKACESCHGSGEQHIQEGGTLSSISTPRNNPKTCLNCHFEINHRRSKTRGHPVNEDFISCTDCHSIHEESSISNPVFENQFSGSESCVNCHAEFSEPKLFNHEAMDQGCATCHDVHGSMRMPFLKHSGNATCLNCHMTSHSERGPVMGGTDHGALRLLPRGACWTAGCHEAVHGSNTSPLLRF